MATDKIYINITVEKQEVQLLKDEKVKLEELFKNISKTKDELVNGNLSGKTNDTCIKNNELFMKTIKKRINTIDSLISKLEYACNSYEEEWNLTGSLVGGTNNVSSNITQSIDGGNV